eukprot:COSAG05_NODE_280_length_12288_cov_4.797933_10_plen_171_part_00
MLCHALSKLVVVGQQRHIPRGRQGLRQRVRRFPRRGRAWVEQADGGGALRHEDNAAVGQQDSAVELVLPRSGGRPAGERVGARVEQADGGGALRHEGNAAVGQQDSAFELVLPRSGGRPAGERVGARVEQTDGGGALRHGDLRGVNGGLKATSPPLVPPRPTGYTRAHCI